MLCRPLFPAYLDRRTYPIRLGTHFNTAFGLIAALHYARIVREPTLEPAIAAYARRVFLRDTDYPAHYEPNGDDFLSGALTEALLMRHLLPADDRSEEHTSELQSLMRISYAVSCLKKKK